MDKIVRIKNSMLQFLNYRRGSGAEFDERLLPESTC